MDFLFFFGDHLHPCKGIALRTTPYCRFNKWKQLTPSAYVYSDPLQLKSSDGADDKSASLSFILARVLSIAGQVAFRQTVFMEEDVLVEMKRRQTVAGEKRNAGGADGNSSRRKSKGGAAVRF